MCLLVTAGCVGNRLGAGRAPPLCQPGCGPGGRGGPPAGGHTRGVTQQGDRRHATSWAATEEGARYERGRPGYPDTAGEALATSLGLGRGRRVADVAAGTGKLTRVLIATGADVIAVEPMPGMREQLTAAVGGARCVAATAEALPLPTASIHAVTVAQAFHWFRLPDARGRSAGSSCPEDAWRS